jgi:hypothetical protein
MFARIYGIDGERGPAVMKNLENTSVIALRRGEKREKWLGRFA